MPWSSTSTLLLRGEHPQRHSVSTTLLLWALLTGIHSLSFNTHTDPPWRFRSSPDSIAVVSGSWSGLFRFRTDLQNVTCREQARNSSRKLGYNSIFKRGENSTQSPCTL